MSEPSTDTKATTSAIALVVAAVIVCVALVVGGLVAVFSEPGTGIAIISAGTVFASQSIIIGRQSFTHRAIAEVHECVDALPDKLTAVAANVLRDALPPPGKP